MNIETFAFIMNMKVTCINKLEINQYMKRLSDPGASQEILNRINSLTATSAAAWGKMNVSQMLVHCRLWVENSMGRSLSRTFFGKLFGGMVNNRVLQDIPIKKNMPTDKRFVNQPCEGFEAERDKLKEAINKFVESSPGGLSADPHPFFGKMNPDEWNILVWKHLDHHLRQFGV
jgi:hypothetical protein